MYFALVFFLLSLVSYSTSSASTVETKSTENSLNSQNMELLQAGPVLSLLSPSSHKDEMDENVDINIVSGNALLASVSHVTDEGASGGPFFSGQTEIYVVRPGDSLSEISEMFGISIDTILSANNKDKNDKIQPGEILLILPFSSVQHTIAKGDTLGGVAQKYDVAMDDILAANEMEKSSKLSIGTKLLIPGGSISSSSSSSSSSRPKSSNSTARSSSPAPAVVSASGFATPVSGARRTRGVSLYHQGVDLAVPAGTPIHVVDNGTVILARNGYNGGFGNYVVVQHSGGFKTLYAHMSRLGTSTGAKVSKGQVIGYVGNTGRSRGNHLHLEFIGRSNPF